jgi:hypothetical protein
MEGVVGDKKKREKDPESISIKQLPGTLSLPEQGSSRARSTSGNGCWLVAPPLTIPPSSRFKDEMLSMKVLCIWGRGCLCARIPAYVLVCV